MSLTVRLIEPQTNSIAYSSSVTHNLTRMANECDLYNVIWHPDSVGIGEASELIMPLASGLARLKGNPGNYFDFEPSNGWGSYRDFFTFVEDYLKACIEFPDALIEVN